MTAEEKEKEKLQYKLLALACVEVNDRIKKSGVEHGIMACPMCGKGAVIYHTHWNGHIHAECTTDGCILILE